MIRSILATFFPPSCFGCKREGEVVCVRCIALTRKSLSAPHAYIVSVFDFREPLIRRAIHAIKYKHRSALIEPLAKELARQLHKESLAGSVLVPIPMTRLRKMIRGYNHAAKIGEVVARELHLSLREDLLVRSRRTSRQALARREKRLSNQRGSFACGNVSGLDILLVDDVTTTGATLDEARSALLKSGARNVRAITLAH